MSPEPSRRRSQPSHSRAPPERGCARERVRPQSAAPQADKSGERPRAQGGKPEQAQARPRHPRAPEEGGGHPQGRQTSTWTSTTSGWRILHLTSVSRTGAASRSSRDATPSASAAASSGPGNKRKQEEQERLRRLQLEIAKKAPVKVLIPDEIGVGELASRMKKTGAEVVKCLMKNGVMASLSRHHRLRHRRHHRRGDGLQGGEGGGRHHRGEADRRPPRTRTRIWCPAPPWWWSWATWTTARPPCWTISATPTWPPARPAASPSTSAPIRCDVNGKPDHLPGHPRP